MSKTLGGVLAGIILIGGVAGSLICTEKIPAGYVGVQYSMNGGIKDEILTQGWHIVSPMKKVTLYSVATETFVMSQDERAGSKDNESFDLTCSDGVVNVDFEMQYNFDANQVTNIFTKYRGVNGETVISTNLRSKIKTIANEVLSRYTVLEAHLEKKAEVNKALTEALREELGKLGIFVESATLPATRVSESIQNSINARTQKAQELEAEKLNQEKALLEQETARINAETEKIKNEEISKSLTKEMLMKMAIEKWDGKLSTVNGSGVNPIFNVGE
jgi:regulator of protease activity HflC (stomatin/prohibitin superfamily)